MDNNFGWNLGGDFIAHYGTKRHSGRYPWGSGAKNGKTPIHEHGEKKHKYSSSSRVDKSSAKRGNSEEDADTKARKAAKAAGLDQGDNWKMYRMAQAGDKKAQVIIAEWEKNSKKPNDTKKENNSNDARRSKLQTTLDADLEVPSDFSGSNPMKLINQVASKTNAYYELMDKKELEKRINLEKEYRELDKKLEENPDNIDAMMRQFRIDDERYETKIEDYNAITQNKFVVGKPTFTARGDDIAFEAFDNTYDELITYRDDHISHSGLDPDNIVRILNTPI